VPDITVPQKVVRVEILLLVVVSLLETLILAVALLSLLRVKCKKGKVYPVHTIKAYRESRGMAPLFLNRVPMEISHVTTVRTVG
jgi:hypothetical protein